ncbi:MAG: hypothetical protein ABI947_09370 [Chloroflexota bacterium]
MSELTLQLPEEPTKELLLEDLRQSMLDALAGRTLPAYEVIEALRQKRQTDADNNDAEKLGIVER